MHPGDRILTLGSNFKGKVVACVNLVGIVPRRRLSRRLVKRRGHTVDHGHVESRPGDVAIITGLGAKSDAPGLRDGHLGTGLLAAPPGADDGVVPLPHLELSDGSVGGGLSHLVDVAPDGGLDCTHDLGLLTEEVVVLGGTSSVVDDDGVLVGHGSCC